MLHHDNLLLLLLLLLVAIVVFGARYYSHGKHLMQQLKSISKCELG